jgi:hypothetical protein
VADRQELLNAMPTPEPGGAEYVAVCVPAFSPATVHRDE